MPIEKKVRAEKTPWMAPKLSLKIPTPAVPIDESTAKTVSGLDPNPLRR
jgi:hypothetical protein